MKIQVIERKYRCPVCQKDHSTETIAEACLRLHVEGYERKCPKYEVGKRVKTHRFSDSHYSLQETTIVKIIGEFLDLQLLVEGTNGERYWITPVSYQTVDFPKDPAPFSFVPLI